MKRLICFLLVLICNFQAFIFAQKVEVVEYKYLVKQKNNNEDTIVKTQTVWISKDRIFSINEEDTIQCVLNDFSADIIKIRNVGPIHTFKLSADRNHNYALSKTNERICNYESNMKLEIIGKTSKYIIYFDTSVCITKFQGGGFWSYLDNGLGYLPIYYNIERSTSDSQYGTFTNTGCLISQRKRTIDGSRMKLE